MQVLLVRLQTQRRTHCFALRLTTALLVLFKQDLEFILLDEDTFDCLEVFLFVHAWFLLGQHSIEGSLELVVVRSRHRAH